MLALFIVCHETFKTLSTGFTARVLNQMKLGLNTSCFFLSCPWTYDSIAKPGTFLCDLYYCPIKFVQAVRVADMK